MTARAIVSPSHEEDAQAVIDAWAKDRPYVAEVEPGLDLPHLLKLIAQALADASTQEWQ